ncbi:MAG: DUF1700 domain-containing protein [Ruminococcaceae bacterium]|nr:DUF1700 domain-containing protein [Oscillospiraceae bacterium]
MNEKDFLKQLRQELSRHGVSNSADIEDIVADFSEHFATGLEQGRSEEDLVAQLGDPADIAAQYALSHPTTAAQAKSGKTASPSETASAPSQPTAEKRYVYAEDYTGKARVAATEQKYNAPASQADSARPSGQPVSSGQPVWSGQPVPSSQPAWNEPRQHVSVEHSGNNALNVILLVLLNLFIAIPVLLVIVSVLVGVWFFGFGVGAASIALVIAAVAEAGNGLMTVILILFAIALAALTLLILIGAFWLTRWFARGLRAYINWNQTVAKGGPAK